jgi:hypothetical protein
MVTDLFVLQILINVSVSLKIATIEQLHFFKAIHLFIQIGDEKDIFESMMRQLPTDHSHQDDWLHGESVGFEFDFIVYG